MEQNPTLQAIVKEAMATAAMPQPATVSNVLMNKLESMRITSQTAVTPHKFLYDMFGIPCFARGELVMITGKKKCGKTFFSSILATLCYRDRMLCMRRVEDRPLRCLYLDTEQSNDTTHDILTNRIIPLIDSQTEADGYTAPFSVEEEMEYYYIVNLRCVPWNERLQHIEAAIRGVHADLVIIDGIRDVVDDINNGILAQQVAESLMRLAEETDCCIVSVLHQNKAADDRTPRGALGTEYGNKCFEEWEMKKEIESGMVVFTVTQTATRKYDIVNKLQFTLDANTGLPVALTNEQQLMLDKASEEGHRDETPDRQLNYDYVQPDGRIDVRKAFGEILADGVEMRSGVLKAKFMDKVGISSEKRYVYCLLDAQKTGVLLRTEYDPKNVTYRLITEPAVPSEA